LGAALERAPLDALAQLLDLAPKMVLRPRMTLNPLSSDGLWLA